VNTANLSAGQTCQVWSKYYSSRFQLSWSLLQWRGWLHFVDKRAKIHANYHVMICCQI